ncbi:MAG: hypothetical protein EPN91_01235 [Salinibacterium sp.]|nr:MAG: hypothetical protein EPN91_01235 [Salinibacterium sp.]
MHSTRNVAAVAVSALLLASLTGCFGGGTPGTDSASGGLNKTACVIAHTWHRDLDDAANQLGNQLESHGLNVTQSTGEGSETFTFNESGHVDVHVDLTFTISVRMEHGLTMTIVQTHSGEPSGEWAWIGNSHTVEFSNWDTGGYSIQNSVIINGVTSDAPITIPSDELGQAHMRIACTATRLTTHSTGSPFTDHWTPAA